jgi:hypothetical protein
MKDVRATVREGQRSRRKVESWVGGGWPLGGSEGSRWITGSRRTREVNRRGWKRAVWVLGCAVSIAIREQSRGGQTSGSRPCYGRLPSMASASLLGNG